MPHYQPGRYRCVIEGQGFGESKVKKTLYFYLRFRPVMLIHSPDDEEPLQSEYQRDVVLYLTDNTVDTAIGHLRDLGWEGTNWVELDPENPNFFDFEGTDVVLSCDHEQNGDKVYERWQFPFSGGGFEHQKEADTIRRINAMFGKALKKASPAKKKSPVKRREELPEPPEEAYSEYGGGDTIPF